MSRATSSAEPWKSGRSPVGAFMRLVRTSMGTRMVSVIFSGSRPASLAHSFSCRTRAA